MRSITALILSAALLSSASSHAIVIGALSSDDNNRRVEVYGVGTALVAFSIFIKNVASKFPMIGGVVLNDQSAAAIDPIKNLEVLGQAGVLTASEVAVIRDDLARLNHLDCRAATCRVTTAELQNTYGVNELTLHYLASLHGLQ